MIWYSDKLDDVVRELNTDLAQGLSDSEAAVRLQEHGSNRLNEKKPRSFLQRFLDQMKDVMIIILLIAALISLGLSIYNFIQGAEADWIEPIVIVLIVIVNGLLGVIQESAAQLAAFKSRKQCGKGTAGRRDAEHPLHRPCARGYRRHRGGGSGSGRLPAAVQRQLQM